MHSYLSGLYRREGTDLADSQTFTHPHPVNTMIVVYKILVVCILQINLLKCSPPSFGDNIERINMDDTKERQITLDQFNLTEEEFNIKKHNMVYRVTSTRATIPEAITEGDDVLKKFLR